MLGCTYGTMFRTTVAGGSYQNGLTVHLQGVPPGLLLTEEEIYGDLLLRKPGQGELASPRREPDIPIIYSGVNAADTMPGFHNKDHTNGTPLVILIPNLDRHFEHIEQYQVTNRTPRPGHASYASYLKYGEWDDAIGAGFFSGRYTATLVAAGAVAKRVLAKHGIHVFAYVKEAAGVRAPDLPPERIRERVEAYKALRREYDAVHTFVYKDQRITPEMRFLEKIAVLQEVERRVPELAEKTFDEAAAREKYGVHPKMNCPDLEAADAMFERIVAVRDEGDSSGGAGGPGRAGVPQTRRRTGPHDEHRRRQGRRGGRGPGRQGPDRLAVQRPDARRGREGQISLQQRRRDHGRPGDRRTDRGAPRRQAHPHHRQAAEDD